MTQRWLALSAVNVVAVIFGSTALFGKLDVSPFWIVAGRGAFAASALLLLSLMHGVPLRSTNGAWPDIALTGALLALHWVTFFLSVQQAGVAVATLTFATFPLVTVVLEAAMQRRLPRMVELISGAAIVLAVLLLVGRGLPATAGAAQGALMGLLSAAAFAMFSLGSQRLGLRVDAVALSLRQNAVVALLLTPALAAATRARLGGDCRFGRGGDGADAPALFLCPQASSGVGLRRLRRAGAGLRHSLRRAAVLGCRQPRRGFERRADRRRVLSSPVAGDNAVAGDAVSAQKTVMRRRLA
jgi:hypothetical protein